MSLVVAYKLLSMAVAVLLGWVAGRARWLGSLEQDPARVLSNVAFFIFVPALLFRTAARIDFGALPWRTLAAFFGPALLTMLAVYLSQRRHRGAVPAVRAISATFGNSVQVGIPVAAALFGEAGLAIHIAIVSVHAVVLLSVATTLVELDLAREAGRSSLRQTLAQTVRNTVVHPVVLPVLAGFAFNAMGGVLPAAVDEALQLLGTAVVPLCLVLIGLTLAYHGPGPRLGASVALGMVKLIAMPALVLLVARWGFGLAGLPLAVVVIFAAMPSGSNSLIFAQRYRTLEAEATAGVVLSTLAFGFTAPLWLAMLEFLARQH